MNLEKGEMFLIEAGRRFYSLAAACVKAVPP